MDNGIFNSIFEKTQNEDAFILWLTKCLWEGREAGSHRKTSSNVTHLGVFYYWTMSDGVCGAGIYCIKQFKKCGLCSEQKIEKPNDPGCDIIWPERKCNRVRNLYQCPLEKDSSTVGGLDC